MKKEVDGIFDTIENAITYYLIDKKVNKMELWKYGINVFELSLFIESHIKSGITKLSQMPEIFEKEDTK